MYCAHCGEKNQDGDRFCSACGAPLETPVDTPNVDSSTEENNSTNHESSDFSSSSYINKPTEVINPDLPNLPKSNFTSSPVTPSPDDPKLDQSSNSSLNFNQDDHSFQGSPFTSGFSQSNQSFLEPDQPSSLNHNKPDGKNKRKMILFGSIGLALVLLVGAGTFLFFNWDNLPFVGSSDESSSETKTSKIVYVGEDESESSIKEESSQESFKISIPPAVSEVPSQTPAPESTTPSEPIKIEPKDPYIGKYRTNYVMKVRAQPNYEGERLGRKEEGVVFEVTKSQAGPNDSVWGQLPDGGWICLKDADLVYATSLD